MNSYDTLVIQDLLRKQIDILMEVRDLLKGQEEAQNNKLPRRI